VAVGLSSIPLRLRTHANSFLFKHYHLSHTELEYAKFLLQMQAYSNLQVRVCLRKYKNCVVVLLYYTVETSNKAAANHSSVIEKLN
jgi:hypothetical protein